MRRFKASMGWLMLPLLIHFSGPDWPDWPDATAPSSSRDQSVTIEAAEDPSASRAARLIHALHDTADPTVFVVAHRGDWRQAPENSLAAIRSAVAAGVHFIELDIRQTADGVLILMHDETLDRTTTGTGRVDQHTHAQVAELRLRNGYGMPTEETIPTLEEALRLTADEVLVYLDKSYDLIAPAMAIADATGTAEQVFFYGRVTIDQLERDYPELVGRLNYLPKVSPETPDLDAYVTGFSHRRRSPALVVSFAEDDPAFLAKLRTWQTGQRLWASPLWPGMCGNRTDDRAVANPDENWGWLLDRGFTMICTDRPTRLLDYLRNRH